MAEAHREEIAKLEALYAAHPEGRVFTHLAEAYRRAGELSRAREILEDGLRRHSDYSSAHVVLGRVLMDLGETEGAGSAFRRVLELDRHNLVALRSLGDLAEKSGELAAAVGYYRDLMALDPGDEPLRRTVARLEAEIAAKAAEPEPEPVPTAEPVHPEPVSQLASDTEAEPVETADLGAADEEEPAEVAEGPSPWVARVETSEDITPFQLTGDEPPTEQTPEEMQQAFGAISAAWESETEMEEEPALPAFPTLETDESDVDVVAGEAPGNFFSGFGWEETGTERPDDESREVVSETPEEAGDDAEWASVERRAEVAWGSEPPVSESIDAPAGEAEVEEVHTWGLPVEGIESSEVVEEVRTWGAAVEETESLEMAELDDEEADAEAPAAGKAGEVVTATMAELYARQGFYDRAIDVYHQLLEQVPEDERLKERLRDVESLRRAAASPLRPVTEAVPPSAAEEDVEDAAEAEDDAWMESVESAWTGVDGVAGAEETPYAWADSASEEGTAGATAGDYFRSLLDWRPGTPPPADREAVLELSDASAVDEDVPELELDAGAVEAAFEEWFGTEPGRGGEGGEPSRGDGPTTESDPDLEMFRTWLKSLKK